MEMNATAEQEFMIMLQERINTLEDELLRLERNIQEHNASQYHKIDIQTAFKEGDTIKKKIEELLDQIFHYRKKIEPVFAAWNWHFSQDKLLMTLLLTSKNPIAEKEMKEYLNYPDMTYSSFCDLYTFIKYFKYYYHDEDEGDTIYNFEYWHSHYGYLYDFIDYEFTDEPFTKSKNYNPSDELQSRLRRWIFKEHNNWVDILRIFL